MIHRMLVKVIMAILTGNMGSMKRGGGEGDDLRL
jgi:hypothetical protein